MDTEQIAGVVADLGVFFDWVPGWAIGLGLIALAVSVALIVHGAAVSLVRRARIAQHPVLSSLLLQTIGPTRMALVVFACAMAIRAAPFEDDIAAVLSRMLVVAFIGLVGWIAIVAVRIAISLYLARFQIDTEDNLLARKHVTQMRILERAIDTVIVVITIGVALMTFDSVRQFGVSLFASAGVAGLAVGLAARPLLANLIAGIQLAMTQPIRIGDAVLVENEWGWIDEITSTYVVIKLWDWRRLIVPLSYFIEKPFQNWTRDTAAIIGSVFIHADYTVPVDRVRAKLEEIAKASPLWDGRVVNLQVTDAKPGTVELRALVSARTSPAAWDLRCEVREKLIAFLQQEHPGALPRQRAEVELAPSLAAEADHGAGAGSERRRERPARESAQASRRPS
jgi:small-conductance mechanosensitive channel